MKVEVYLDKEDNTVSKLLRDWADIVKNKEKDQQERKFVREEETVDLSNEDYKLTHIGDKELTQHQTLSTIHYNRDGSIDITTKEGVKFTNCYVSDYTMTGLVENEEPIRVPMTINYEGQEK